MWPRRSRPPSARALPSGCSCPERRSTTGRRCHATRPPADDRPRRSPLAHRTRWPAVSRQPLGRLRALARREGRGGPARVGCALAGLHPALSTAIGLLRAPDSPAVPPSLRGRRVVHLCAATVAGEPAMQTLGTMLSTLPAPATTPSARATRHVWRTSTSTHPRRHPPSLRDGGSPLRRARGHEHSGDTAARDHGQLSPNGAVSAGAGVVGRPPSATRSGRTTSRRVSDRSYQRTGPSRSTIRPVPASGASVARVTIASVPSVTDCGPVLPLRSVAV